MAHRESGSATREVILPNPPLVSECSSQNLAWWSQPQCDVCADGELPIPHSLFHLAGRELLLGVNKTCPTLPPYMWAIVRPRKVELLTEAAQPVSGDTHQQPRPWSPSAHLPPFALLSAQQPEGCYSAYPQSPRHGSRSLCPLCSAFQNHLLPLPPQPLLAFLLFQKGANLFPAVVPRRGCALIPSCPQPLTPTSPEPP